MSSTQSGQHVAAVLPAKGSPLEVVNRPTPTPGPHELLIEVKSIALNPIDYYQAMYGFPEINYPAVIGSDIGGVVVSAGSAVDSDAPKPGTRVAAIAHTYYTKGAPDTGAFQKYVLIPSTTVTPLPDKISFNEAALLPLAVSTSLIALFVNGVPADMAYKVPEKQGLLLWGGSSSIGSAGIQIAKLFGFKVYTTSSEVHHEYLKTLGATRTFDYKAVDVEASIVKAAKEDGVTIQMGYDAVGQLQSCINILQQTKGEGTAKLASAVPLTEDSPTGEGIEIKFVASPDDVKKRDEQLHFVFRVWLKEKLETGEFMPSPHMEIVEGGLASLQKGLDLWKKGVSGTKLVLEI